MPVRPSMTATSPRNHGQNVNVGGKGTGKRERIRLAIGLYQSRKLVAASSMTCSPNATDIAIHAAPNDVIGRFYGMLDPNR